VAGWASNHTTANCQAVEGVVISYSSSLLYYCSLADHHHHHNNNNINEKKRRSAHANMHTHTYCHYQARLASKTQKREELSNLDESILDPPYQDDTLVPCAEERRVLVQTERAEHTQAHTCLCRIILSLVEHIASTIENDSKHTMAA
jgi:hypothetical protein